MFRIVSCKLYIQCMNRKTDYQIIYLCSGQTGSGKTYTMLDPEHGLYVMAARDIFNMLKQPEYQHLTAWIGFYEIYQGQLYDLLNQRKKLFAREDGKQNVVIVGLKEYVINDVNDLMHVFEYGSAARSTGSCHPALSFFTKNLTMVVLQEVLVPIQTRHVRMLFSRSYCVLARVERKSSAS